MDTHESLRWAEETRRVRSALHAHFARLPAIGPLHEAMQYSLFAGGKAIRPLLCLEACRFSGGRTEDALDFACALEMIHCYSLIHDDLPCMDDDALRRGKPSCHIAFSEGTAVLAGDALLTYAFQVAAEAPLPPHILPRAISLLAAAMGPQGMVGGQMLDLMGEGAPLSLAELAQISRLKTGKALVAAVQLGCLAAGGPSAEFFALTRYAQALGLAFQIQDDYLDLTGSEQTLGKRTGADARQGKYTFATRLGAEGCRRMVAALTDKAAAALADFSQGGSLTALANQLSERET